MSNKNGKKTQAKTSTSHIEIHKIWVTAAVTIIVALLGLLGTLFGNPVISAKLFPSATPILPTTSSYDQALTQVAINTQQSDFLNTAIAVATQTANSVATQQYLYAYQTAQANIELTRISEQAEQDVATQQAFNAENTAQAVVSTQQASTAIAFSKMTKSERAIQFFNIASTINPVVFDTFDDDHSGWTPTKNKNTEVSIQDSVFTADISTNANFPFLWTCDLCGPFDNFSIQIDILTPYNTHNVLAGIYFGSPTRIDKDGIEYFYTVLINSSGAVNLERLSTSDRKVIQKWEGLGDFSDGKFRTLQVIIQSNFVMIFLDGNMVGEYANLPEAANGYIGIDVHTTNVRIKYDNLKITNMP